MRVRLRTRQMATVVALVAASALALATVLLVSVVDVRLEESTARAELLARTVFQRAQQIVPAATDPRVALRDDAGIRAILESSIAYTRDVAYAAVVDATGVVIAHSSPGLQGAVLDAGADLTALMEQNTLARLRSVYRESVLEVSEPLVLGDTPFGAIRIGLSPVLIRAELERTLRAAAIMVGVTLVAAMLLSGILAHWALKPIHLIRAGLTRLEEGEQDVQLELPADPDLVGVERSFQTLSQRLAGDREMRATTPSRLADRLGDGLAILEFPGVVVFANEAMRRLLAVDADPPFTVSDVLPDTHPGRRLIESAWSRSHTTGPETVRLPVGPGSRPSALTAHVVPGQGGRAATMLLVGRDLGQVRLVESTLRSTRQLASMGRLLAGVAHEVKNPINAMLIHLELLQKKLTPTAARDSERPVGAVLGVQSVSSPQPARDVDDEPDHADPERSGAVAHVEILGNELRRLDSVIQGLLRFIRPQDIEKETVFISDVVDEVCALVQPEAHQRNVVLEQRCPGRIPPVLGDRGMLRQALLNLALNACQAMPSGGTVRISAGTTGTPPHVWVDVEDTGTGMSPAALERIFDLYYTTKDGGSGIGLSMVHRIVQLHDGDIEVESTPGHGSRFRVTLPGGDGATTAAASPAANQ